MSSRYAVTGAAGFIGSTLAQRLVDLGEEVVGLDSFTPYYSKERKLENLAALRDRKNFRLINMNVGDDRLVEALKGCKFIFHLAGQPGVRSSWGRDFNTYSSNNIEATQKLLEASLRLDVDKLVYASSSSVYGDADRYPVSEDMLPRPMSPYGVSKLAAEHLAVLYAQQFGLNTFSLRYFTVYGPRQRPEMAFSQFISNALSGQMLRVNGDGEQIRDFTFVDDIVDANISAMRSQSPRGVVANVSGGEYASVNSTISILEDLLNTKLSVTRGDAVKGDVYRTGGATDQMTKLTGWRPSVGLREGLSRQIDWQRTVERR